jgi:hypothetical protein
MSALTVDRNTPRRDGDIINLGVAASKKIYAGALVARDASGYATPGATATTILGIGRAEAQADNSSGSAGDITVDVRKGVFQFANSAGGDEITTAEIGTYCYIVDDQTVAKTNGSGTRSVAGRVLDVDSTGVWVEFSRIEAPGTVATADLAADAVTGAKIADDAVSLEHLDSAITPSHIVVYAGEHTTAGGAAAEDITVTGALATDLAVCTLHTKGATPRVIVTALAAADKVTVTFDGDPSTDHVVTYTVLRAAA